MIVQISPSGGVSLVNFDNFRAFHVSTHLGPDESRASLERLGGSLVDDHAWIPPEWIRSSGAPEDAAWLSQLDSMLQYASSKDWVEPGTGRIRAHVEWAGDA